ncbi:MAG: glycosyltransferase [Candidatus Woesearchaeota archaeon]
MNTGISVCIAARNEENNIEQTVYSALKQDIPQTIELLVCANGCTDSTEEIVKSIAKKDSRVRLLTSDPGKPCAWNTLMEESKYDTIIFADGDVILGKNSINALVQFMDNQNLIGASSKMKKIIKTPLDYIFSAPLTEPCVGGIVGRLYAIKKKEFVTEMAAKGYSKMPNNIICEDLWVSLILEERKEGVVVRKRWGYCSDAVVLYQAPTSIDDYKTSKRNAKGAIQLEREHPQLGYLFSGKTIKEKVNFLAHKYYAIDNRQERIKKVITYFLRRMKPQHIINYIAHYHARTEYDEGKCTNLWDIPLSTKEKLANQVISKYTH